METAALLCHNLATQKGLDIGWFVDPSLPPALCIDSMRVQQCLLNLLSNAIKFTRSVGHAGRAFLHAGDMSLL